jgi:hypothetical protein
MALTNYGELKTAVASWLARSDLTTVIPDFVFLAHKQLQRELKGHLRLQKRASLSITGQYVAAPTDFLELVSIYRGDGSGPILYMSPDEMVSYFDSTSSGEPKYVCLSADTTPGAEYFRFAPVPDTTYAATIEYYATMGYFVSDVATNWVLTDHPDVYLYGSLLQARAFLGDDGRIPTWLQAYQMAVNDVRKHGHRSRWGASGMAQRPG